MNKEDEIGGKRTVIVSVSSDIGAALAERWLRRGWSVAGTYRTESAVVHDLSRKGVALVQCDVSESKSVVKACADLRSAVGGWDVLVLCPGAQEPIGPFVACAFAEWECSVRVNFTGQMHVVREMLPARSKGSALGPSVLFFAGGGTNNATVNYSAYTVCKIALIKVCELLDAEIGDTKFTIIGPGWVKTKIHAATLAAGTSAGTNYDRTIQKLAGDDGWTSMDNVVSCCDWVVASTREVVGGRNFSVASDRWGTPEIAEALVADPQMYKLRRQGNDWAPKRREPHAKS